MPASRQQRVVATAVCIALGGTALLTWAFSIFTEEKSKRRPSNAPSSLPQATGSPRPDTPGASDRSAADKESVASLAAEQLAGQGQEGPALVIENTSAVESGKGTGTQSHPWYNRSNEQSPPTTAANRSASPLGSNETPPQQSADFFKNSPKFDEKYNSSLSKTPIADAVSEEHIGVVERKRSSSPRLVEQRISQLDTKVTTYEERQPVTQQISSEAGENVKESIPASVSCKSLEKAVMYAPKHEARSRTVSSSGVDNSIAELKGAPREVMHLESGDDSQEFTYNRSTSFLSENEKGQSKTPPLSNRKNLQKREGEQPSSLDASDHYSSLAASDNMHISKEESTTASQQKLITAASSTESGSQPVGQVEDKIDLRDRTQPPQGFSQTGDDAFDINDNVCAGVRTTSIELLPESMNADEVQEPIGSTAVAASSQYHTEIHLQSPMQKELTPASSHESCSSSPGSHSIERSEMNFQIGVDKVVSSSPESGSPRHISHSPLSKSQLSVNSLSDTQSIGSIERSEYYSPPKLERELLPEVSGSLPQSFKSLQRSEVNFQLSGQKSKNMLNDDGIGDATEKPEPDNLNVATAKPSMPTAELNEESEMNDKMRRPGSKSVNSVEKNGAVGEQEKSNVTLESSAKDVNDPHKITQDPNLTQELSIHTSSPRLDKSAQLHTEDVHPECQEQSFASKDPIKQAIMSNTNSISDVATLNEKTHTGDGPEVAGTQSTVAPPKSAGLLDKHASDEEVGPTTATTSAMRDKDLSHESTTAASSTLEPRKATEPSSTDAQKSAPLDAKDDPNLPTSRFTPLGSTRSESLPPSIENMATEVKIFENTPTESKQIDGSLDKSGLGCDKMPEEEVISPRLTPEKTSLLEREPHFKMEKEKLSPDCSGLSKDQKELRDDCSSTSSEGPEYSRRQLTETEEVIETSVEETVTMVITGVVSNPEGENEEILSMQDAVNQGLLDLENGLYHNRTTGEKMSMIEAMNAGYIKMGPKKVETSEEKVKSVGIITIKTMRETMPYTVKAAKDTRNNQMYHIFQATRRKILDSEKGTFTDLQTGSKMLMGDAIDLGLVEVDYDTSAAETFQEEITKTYSVHAVVDQQERARVAFHEAVSRGLIDPDTGEYVHNVTNARVSVEEAISRGFIKATLASSAEDISVDGMGSRVAEQGVDAIRKKVLTPLHALQQMKQ
ncbi:serine-rich adhesin for platelets-like isoform X2 [Watersipora subatra]|uniref:serine-rich adhesin for platelets-like isoform X2 n=1 Tax=Watersipora subatra TaxID=2589382 RepID=UPI00355B03B4